MAINQDSSQDMSTQDAKSPKNLLKYSDGRGGLSFYKLLSVTGFLQTRNPPEAINEIDSPLSPLFFLYITFPQFLIDHYSTIFLFNYSTLYADY